MASAPEMREVLQTLKSLEEQNRKLAQYQEVSYRWHVEHHDALKRMLSSLKELLTITKAVDVEQSHRAMPIGFDRNPGPSTVIESPMAKASLPHRQTSTIGSRDKEQTLNEMLMRHIPGTPVSPRLEQALLSVSESEFASLTPECVTILMPILVGWMEREETFKNALVWVYELSQQYLDTLRSIENKSIVDYIREILIQLSQRPDLCTLDRAGLTPDEARQLARQLM